MSFLEKNMALFNKRVSEFEFPTVDDEESKNYTIEVSKTGFPILKYKDENSVRYVNSKYDPQKDGDTFARNYKNKIEATNTIVLMGLDLGYNARGFLKCMNPNNLLIIYEPSWYIFRLAMENVDLTDILSDTRVAFIFSKDYSYLSKYLNNFVNIYNYEHIVYTVNPFYKIKYIEEYKLFSEALLQVISSNRIGFETLAGWGKIWTETIIKNIPHFINSVKYDDFKNLFIDKPIIVVAAGPSLDKNIVLLKKVENKFPIVCVYTAYKALQKNNIKPNFIITLDSNQTIFEDDEDKKEVFNIPIAYLCTANTELLDRFNSGKIYCNTNTSTILKNIVPKKFYDVATIYTGGTITISALQFAAYLGGNPIITIGFDLAFEGNKSHASNTTYDKNKEASQILLGQSLNENVYVKGINGEKLRVTSVFESYLRSTEELVQSYPEIKFIDATEGGALIKGTTVDTFANTIEKYKDNYSDHIEESVLNIFKTGEFINEDDIQEIIQNLHESKEKVKIIYDCSKEGKELSEKVFGLFAYGSPDIVETKPIIERYYELDDIMNNEMDDLPLFFTVKDNVMRVLKSHQPYHEENEQLYFAKHSMILYKEFEEISDKIINAIDYVLGEIDNPEPTDGI